MCTSMGMHVSQDEIDEMDAFFRKQESTVWEETAGEGVFHKISLHRSSQWIESKLYCLTGNPVLWWRHLAPRADPPSNEPEEEDDPLPTNPALRVGGARRTNRASVPKVISPGKFVVILEADDDSGTWEAAYTFRADHGSRTTACQIGKVMYFEQWHTYVQQTMK